MSGLDHEERREERGGRTEQAECLRRRPAGVVAVHDRVDREHERRRHGDRAGDVEACPRGRPRRRDEPQRQRVDRGADRDVHHEDGVPAEDAREDAAKEHADAPATGGDEADDAHGLRALGGLGEETHHQRQARRGDDRAAEALRRARRDEDGLRRRDAGGERCGGEDRDAGGEETAVPVEVAEAAAEKEEPAEEEHVRVHDPGEGCLGESEVLADRRERDVHDRRVEHDHEAAEREHGEGEPAAAVICDHGVPPHGFRGLDDRCSENSSVPPMNSPDARRLYPG
jgi:hypothetical protein